MSKQEELFEQELDKPTEEEKPKKVKKPRKPLSEERKAQLREQLKSAREKSYEKRGKKALVKKMKNTLE